MKSGDLVKVTPKNYPVWCEFAICYEPELCECRNHLGTTYKGYLMINPEGKLSVYPFELFNYEVIS